MTCSIYAIQKCDTIQNKLLLFIWCRTTYHYIRRWLNHNNRLGIDYTAIQWHPFYMDIGHSRYHSNFQVNRLHCNYMQHKLR